MAKAQSREEFLAKIKNAAAANDAPAVEELTRRMNTEFPVQEGGVSPTAAPGPGGTADDVANAIGSNLTQAFTTDLAGSVGDIRDLGNAATNYLFPNSQANFEKYGGISLTSRFPTSAELVEKMPEGFAYEAKTTPGKYLGTTARMAGNLASPGGALRKGAMMVAPGMLSEAAGQATEGTDWEPWARLAAAVAGGTGAGVFPAWRSVDERAVTKVLTELRNSGMTPQQAAAELQRRGPEAMLADVNPGMQVVTAATGTVDPGAATTITERLRGRREGGGPNNSPGAQARTRGYLDQAMGPYRDPWNVREANIASREQVGPQYTAAIENAPQLPGNLDDLIAEGMTFPMADMSIASRETMGQYFDQIDDALRADTPSSTAARLHDIRKRLDRQLHGSDYGMPSADKADRGVLQNVRNIIDEILKDRVPGFREADEAFSPIEKQREAFDQGRTDVMRAGPSTMTEGQLRHIYRNSTPEVNQSRTQGIRSELERQTANERQNPALTVDRTLGRDFNREKVGIQIGPSRADRLADQLDTEGTFLETSNLAEAGRGSRTAPLRETAQRVWGAGGDRGVTGDMLAAGTGGAFAGGPGAGLAASGLVAVNRMIGAAADRLSRPAAAVIRQTADNLTVTGPRRAALVRALIDESARVPLGAQTRERTEALVRVLLSTATGAGAATP